MHTDPQAAANAYAAALRGLGLGLCAVFRTACAAVSKVAVPPAPADTLPDRACVDSMATYWVVNSVDKLYRVDQRDTGMSITTANGAVPVTAIGTALTYLLVGDAWECYEVPNVMVLEGTDHTLYSTRVMNACFGFKHAFESRRVTVPWRTRYRYYR